MTLLIGLTGKSGAGKSEVGKLFEQQGIPTINADAVYHKILQEKNACTDELIATFGETIAAASGGVDRKALSRTVFSSKDVTQALHTLNEITHKYIMANVKDLLRFHEQNGKTAVVFDAPQLFEAKADADCDVILGVIAEDHVCVRRIMARDGIDEERARLRLASQHDNAFFKAHCHAVIENNTDDPEDLALAVCRFIKTLGV